MLSYVDGALATKFTV
jgi:acyl-CoA oxidase